MKYWLKKLVLKPEGDLFYPSINRSEAKFVKRFSLKIWLFPNNIGYLVF